MKIVIVGGSGLIGSKLVARLRDEGHEAVPASPNTGVNTLTGEGLAEVLAGADVVVDVSNSPSFEDAAVLEFFETSTGNLLAAEAAAGVGHHVAMSVVGSDRSPGSGYLRAKVAQETLIRSSPIPYTIVRSTQFFEFLARIADEATEGNTVRIAPVLFQPIAADDVATQVGRIAVSPPVNGIVEIAGPQQFRFDEFIRMGLAARGDPRQVVAHPRAKYFGSVLDERSLVPGADARLGEIRFEEWLGRNGVPMKADDAKRKAGVRMAGLVAVLVCAVGGRLMAQQAVVTPVMTKELPDIPGKEALMLTVEYPPGSKDQVHRHNADAFVYVLEGSIVMQVKGGKPVTLTPGQTFYEGPDDIHVVGRNASTTKPAKFLVLLVKKKGAPALVPAN
jgi:uncharacterized protein YbjT (DUF2867 family)/quercetin dioxygenase-like cupin family protein